LNKLKTMLRIRLFEERVSELKLKGSISGPVHTCIGQEAVATGVCMALSKEDYIIGNHRSHGHLIAKGADIKTLMSNILKGNGSSMHVKDVSVGAICSTAIVGSGLPLACGIAFASKFKKDGKITCVFFGDGAVNEGSFYEAINIASLWNLPVLFIIENNGVAVTTTLESISKDSFLINRVKPFNIFSEVVDGQDIERVYNITTSAIETMKKRSQPAIIEARTMRFKEHQEGVAFDKMKEVNYRDNGEVKYWIDNKDPIQMYMKKLMNMGISPERISEIYFEERQFVNNEINSALNEIR